jgi:biofilm PGA synthesis lipoprotein PgaB
VVAAAAGPGVPLTALRRRNLGNNARAAKVMHVDLDNIHDPDPAQTERNGQLLLSRIRAMGVNTV